MTNPCLNGIDTSLSIPIEQTNAKGVAMSESDGAEGKAFDDYPRLKRLHQSVDQRGESG